MTRIELEGLRDRVLALTPADRLRLAAELLDSRLYGPAEPIVRMVADELTALRLLGERPA